jgi:hypothetical protein
VNDVHLDSAGFDRLLERVAEAWRTGRPDDAVSCFASDIVYVEPGGRQAYRGLDMIRDLSGGDDPSPMDMRWHTTLFDKARQLGAGEYTFRGQRQFHGFVLVQVQNGRIHLWREYQYHDEGPWSEFVGDSALSVS